MPYLSYTPTCTHSFLHDCQQPWSRGVNEMTWLGFAVSIVSDLDRTTPSLPAPDRGDVTLADNRYLHEVALTPSGNWFTQESSDGLPTYIHYPLGYMGNLNTNVVAGQLSHGVKAPPLPESRASLAPSFLFLSCHTHQPDSIFGPLPTHHLSSTQISHPPRDLDSFPSFFHLRGESVCSSVGVSAVASRLASAHCTVCGLRRSNRRCGTFIVHSHSLFPPSGADEINLRLTRALPPAPKV